MSKEWLFIPGENWVICDVCGFKYRSKEMRLRWDNLWVCRADFEQRHPQDFVQARIDKIPADIIRPPPAPDFVTTGQVCTIKTLQGVAGYGTAGCAQAGIDLGER